jgi:hypothetical protein
MTIFSFFASVCNFRVRTNVTFVADNEHHFIAISSMYEKLIAVKPNLYDYVVFTTCPWVQITADRIHWPVIDSLFLTSDGEIIR